MCDGNLGTGKGLGHLGPIGAVLLALITNRKGREQAEKCPLQLDKYIKQNR